LEEKKMAAFEQRKQREVNRKFNKQVSELRKQEKSQKVKQNMEDVSDFKKGGGGGRGGGADKETPQKSKKRLAMVRSEGYWS
jgi:hypothetical protein